MKQKGQSQSRKGSFLGSDAKIRRRTLQESSPEKKVDEATKRRWGENGHYWDSSKPISPDTRKQDGGEGVYVGLDLRVLEEAENNTAESGIWPSDRCGKREGDRKVS